MHDKPQGYKRQANALNICRNQGLSNLYQTDKEPDRYIPIWNLKGECVGFKNAVTGAYLNPERLPVDEITGYRILPGMADVPFLFAEYGQNKSVSGRHGKRINIYKVRTSEHPRAKYRTTNIDRGEAMDKQEGYSCALVTLDKPQKVRRVNRHAKVVVHREDDFDMATTRSSRRFR